MKKTIFFVGFICCSLFIFSCYVSNLLAQPALYFARQARIQQPSVGGTFAQLENDLNHSLNNILSSLYQPGNVINVNSTNQRLDNIWNSLQNMDNLDNVTYHYYAGLVHYGKWLLNPQNSNNEYTQATQHFNQTIDNNNPSVLGDLAVYYYSGLYLKGLLFLHHYWISSNNNDLINGIQSLHQAINEFNSENTDNLRYSAEILIAWAEIERCYTNPTTAQINTSLNDIENVLTGNFGNNNELLQIKKYFLAVTNYLRSIFCQDSDCDDLLTNAKTNIDSIRLDGFPSAFTNAIFWAQFAVGLRSNILSHEDMPTLIFPDLNVQQTASFYQNFVSNGISHCNFAGMMAPNINIPEIQFLNILADYFACFDDLNTHRNDLSGLSNRMSNFITNNPNHPFEPYAQFFQTEIRFYNQFANDSAGIPGKADIRNLPQELSAFLRQRRLLSHILSNGSMFQSSVNWHNKADPFVIIISNYLDGIAINMDNLFDVSSPITTLFSLSRINQNYYQPLINLLGYLYRNATNNLIRNKLSILIGYAIHRSNIADAATANRALTWLNFISKDESVEAERKLAGAFVRYYGLGDNGTAFNLLQQVNDMRARELATAWGAPAIPPGDMHYDFIGFDIKNINNYRIIVCDYNYDYYNTGHDSYLCYKKIVKQLLLNRPYQAQLLSIYPIPFLRFALQLDSIQNGYMQDMTLMQFLESGINIGQHIPVTFIFPQSGATLMINGGQNIIEDAQKEFNLQRFTKYKISCDLDTYYRYTNEFVFTRTTTIHLDSLMTIKKNWKYSKKYNFPYKNSSNSKVYFFDIDISNNTLAFLAAMDEHFYIGIKKDGFELSDGSVEIYEMPNNIIPSDIVLDNSHSLFISDLVMDKIYEIDIEKLNAFLKFEEVRTPGFHLDQPSDLFFYSDSIFVTDSQSNRILRINRNNYNDFSQINHPFNGQIEFISITPDNLFFASSTQIGCQSGAFVDSLSNIYGIRPFVSNKNYLYVGDILSNCIKVFTPFGDQVDSILFTEGETPFAIYKTDSKAFIAAKDAIYIYDLENRQD